ncbi:hypothetical protein V8F06_009262 [Rhypophila decipiens]
MAPTWTTIKSYNFTRRALEAWVTWRFAAALELGGAQVIVKRKDGDFNVYAPEPLSTQDKRALKRELKNKEDWSPPAETWEELNGGYTY